MARNNPFEYISGYHISQLNPEICLRLVQGNGMLLPRIPRNLRTNEVLIAAVKSAPKVIKQLDTDDITKEMYDIAVSKDKKLAKFAPSAILTVNDYIELWKTNDISYDALLSYIPEKYLPNVYDAVVNTNAKYLAVVPYDYRTRKMCELAISRGLPGVVSLIPSEFMDQKMYNNLVSGNLIEFKQIPEKFLSSSIITILLGRNSSYLNVIPESLLTKRHAMFCILDYRYDIDKIPKKLLDKDIYELYFAVSHNLKKIPKEYWNTSMLLSYVTYFQWHRRGLTLADIPEHLQSDAVKFAIEDPQEHN